MSELKRENKVIEFKRELLERDSADTSKTLVETLQKVSSSVALVSSGELAADDKRVKEALLEALVATRNALQAFSAPVQAEVQEAPEPDRVAQDA